MTSPINEIKKASELNTIQEQNKEIPIIFAEDDPVDREMIFRAIKKTPFSNSVHFLKDGSEALEYMSGTGQYNWRIRHNLPKVIVLDIRMPKVSGLEVLKKLKSDDHTKHLPVIIFTSSTADYDCKESYRLGANSFIIKPFNFEDFQQTVIDMTYYWITRNHPLE